MRQIPLGRTGLAVSELCLGTMTWGTQNTEAEGHAQIDMALERGVTFWDTAEMYPTNPVRAETVGRTEEIIGTWFAASGRRDEVVLATKITGKGQMVRPGEPISGATMRAAVDGSLRRLRTDYIDLYQLHWPNRGSYHFRQMWRYAPTGTDRDDRDGADDGCAGDGAGAGRRGQDPRHRAVERKRLGGGALAASGRDPGPAAHGERAERILPALPPVRYRLGRVQPDRGHAASGVLAPRRRSAVGQICGRRDAGRHRGAASPPIWAGG